MQKKGARRTGAPSRLPQEQDAVCLDQQRLAVWSGVTEKMSADVAMIAEVPIFELMDDTERESLAQMMECREFKAGTVLFEYGDHGGEIFILRSGDVEVFVENQEGEKIVLAENERGDVVGELSFLDGGSRTATAFAREDTQTLTIHPHRLMRLIAKHPHSAIAFLTLSGL